MIAASVDSLLRAALELHRGGRIAEAQRYYERILALDPSQPEALSLLPSSRGNPQVSPEDKAWGGRAIEVSPLNLMTRINYGCSLKAVGELSAASKEFQAAQVLDPADADGNYNEGVLHADTGRIDSAIRHYRRCLTIDPESLLAKSNLGLCLLTTGDFKEGWKLYETRFSYEEFRAWNTYQFNYPRWDGVSNLRGKTITLWTEQGLGDSLQFCRFASVLAERGAIVTLLASPSLHRILSSLPGSLSILCDPPERQDFHFPLMSLPRVLGITAENIPYHSEPYLAAKPSVIQEWSEILGDTPKPRIGIVWRAGNVSKISGRNLDIGSLAKLSQTDVQFISLQKEVPPEEQIFIRSHTNIELLERNQDDFADTAAIIASLDLVISVDTSVAHLAGAMGKDAWILLPMICDWRWMTARPDSPWYSSARLYRQTVPGQWTSVIEDLQHSLEQRFGLTR